MNDSGVDHYTSLFVGRIFSTVALVLVFPFFIIGGVSFGIVYAACITWPWCLKNIWNKVEIREVTA